MRSDTQQRRLAAIVAADVVGYTRLTEKAEGSVHTALMSLRTNLIDPQVKLYNGRIVKNTGDGFLCEFGSILDAAQFAIDFQTAMASYNEKLPDERRISFRTGINVGDILVESDDIYGEGVNAAVRLESVADIGGIAVSESVYTAVKNRLPVKFKGTGRQKLKNIEEPIRVYRIVEVEGVRLGQPASHSFLRHRLPVLTATAAVVVMAMATTLIWQNFPRSPIPTDPQIADWSLPLPDKPSVAVLPFENLSGNANQDYFSDGITEDLITYLSKFARIFVIAKNSSFKYKGPHRDIGKIGRELGVQYLIEGSVRKIGDSVRINAHLVDASAGHQLWSERYDSEISNVFALQDKIARKVVTAIATNISPGEDGPVGGIVKTKNPRAYDAYLHGWEYYRRRTPADFRRALASFRKATALDPDYAEAHAGLASIYTTARLRLWHRHVGVGSRYAAEVLARKSLEKAMHRPTSLAYQVSARLLYFENRHEEAIGQINRAIAEDPNDPENYWVKSIVLVWAGQAEEASAAVKIAMRLDPHYPSRYQAHLGIAQFGVNRFNEAATHLERANRRYDGYELSLVHQLAAYGYLDRLPDARKTLSKISSIRKKLALPPLTISTAKQAYPFKHDIDRNRLISGLRLAGVPDGNLTSAGLGAGWQSKSLQ